MADAPGAFGMRWYPLDTTVGVVHNFFHHLWRRSAGQIDAVCGYSAAAIPDTVMFRANAPYCHYFTSVVSHGVSRKHAHNVTNAKVFEAFCRPQYAGKARASVPQATASGADGDPPGPVCATFMYELLPGRDGSTQASVGNAHAMAADGGGASATASIATMEAPAGGRGGSVQGVG